MITYHGLSKAGLELPLYDVVLTTYGTLMSEYTASHREEWAREEVNRLTDLLTNPRLAALKEKYTAELAAAQEKLRKAQGMVRGAVRVPLAWLFGGSSETEEAGLRSEGLNPCGAASIAGRALRYHEACLILLKRQTPGLHKCIDDL